MTYSPIHAHASDMFAAIFPQMLSLLFVAGIINAVHAFESLLLNVSKYWFQCSPLHYYEIVVVRPVFIRTYESKCDKSTKMCVQTYVWH